MRKLIERFLWAAVVGFSFLGIAISLAYAGQDVVTPPSVSPWQSIGMDLLAMLGSTAIALLGWLFARLNAWIKAKTHNELVSGVISRFTNSLLTAIKMVEQTYKRELIAAKDPKSPGGAAITKEEAAKLKGLVIEALSAEYGGMSGIAKFLGVLGLGSEASVAQWVDNKIEALVYEESKTSP